MQRIDPCTYQDWPERLLATPQASVFHTTQWLRVLQASYGYQPYYFAAFHGRQLTALLPVLQVQSRLTGVRGVSLPFSDYCEPICPEQTSYHELLAPVLQTAAQQRWQHLELRGGSSLLRDVAPSTVYERHLLPLESDATTVFTQLRGNYRAKIRKAAASGLTVSIDRSSEAMQAYYRLHCLTRKRQGLPPQPARFFRQIQTHLINAHYGFLSLVWYQGQPVAGAVFLTFGQRALYKFGASDTRFQYLYPNYLLFWHVIQWLCQHNYTELCFGRSAPNNTGLIQFKDGWGTTRSRLSYYTYHIKTASFVPPTHHWSESGSQLWRKMPMPLLKLAGSVLYKHLA